MSGGGVVGPASTAGRGRRVTSPSWLTSSPAQQGADDRRRTRAGGRCARPCAASASPVMCSLLASPRAQRRPEPARVHRAEGGDRLGDDRRVVALARRVDDAERQRRGLQRRAEPRPGERRVALAGAPRREVVRRHRGVEAGRLGLLDARRAARWDGPVRASSGTRRPACAAVPCAWCHDTPACGIAGTGGVPRDGPPEPAGDGDLVIALFSSRLGLPRVACWCRHCSPHW